jgi:hypothetical protein
VSPIWCPHSLLHQKLTKSRILAFPQRAQKHKKNETMRLWLKLGLDTRLSWGVLPLEKLPW